MSSPSEATVKSVGLPTELDSYLVAANAPQKTFRCGFDAVVAVGPDTDFFTQVALGAGMGVSQAAGSLVVTTGTTTYAETLLRYAKQPFAANMTLRYSMNLSQRIANQQFYIELVDLIGDNLAMVINSATSVTVTIPNNPFTAKNVGQSMYIGLISVASCPGGRYAIASVSGNNVTFTVASFPGSGTGTCSLFGWNYDHIIYDSTVATAANFDAQRGGWSSGETAMTINTTAAPGHVLTMAVRDATIGVLDQLSASSLTLENTLRASRVRNTPEDFTNLFLQIRVINLAVAPGSTTTLSVGFIEVENFVPQQVTITGVTPMGLNAALPVQEVASTPGVGAANLGKAEDAVAASGDTGVFVLGVRRDALVASASATGDYSEMAVNTYGANLVQDYEKSAKTYSATVNVAAAATATDIALINGNASNTCFVTKVTISGIQTTAGLVDVLLIKRSTANSGGTSGAGTAVPHDSSDAAASSAVLGYTANPTPGATVGNVRRGYLVAGALATSVVNEVLTWEFGDKGRPVILRGVAQGLAVNLNSVTVTGGVFTITFEWIEI